MPFRRVAFFIKCRARGCGICSCSDGRRNCSVRNALILSTAAPKNGAPIEVDKNRAKCPNFVYRSLEKGPARPSK